MILFIHFLSVTFSFVYWLGRLCRCDGILRAVRYAKWKARLKYVGEGAIFYSGIVIHGPDKVSIGEGTAIAEYVHMWGGGGIEIGRNVLIAAHTVITSMTHDKHAEIYARSSVMKRVCIGDNVWIGSQCVILPGVTIGKDAIIGAGAVVTKDVASGDIVVGVPARSLKSI
jgi:maltose O-acetyltransferase